MFRARLAATLAALAAAMAILLLPLPLPRNAIAYALEDAGHMPLAATLAGLCLWVLSAGPQTLRGRCLSTLFLGLTFGAATELLQGLTGRDASWVDLRNDTLGVSAAIAVHCLWVWRRDRRTSAASWIEGPALALAVLVIAAGFWLVPLGLALQAWHERENRFPVLYAADFARSEFFVQPVGTTALPLLPQPRDGRLALPVHCGTARFSGVTLDGLPRDWRRWRELRVEVANPTDAPFDLGILVREARRRIAYDERFNIHLTLRARETRSIVLPLAEVMHGPRGRPLDLARVGTIGVFCAGKPRQFELLRVALQ